MLTFQKISVLLIVFLMKIFFNSSLPRSGSTLIQNILGQNPDFYVTPTSGVLELLYGAQANFTNSPEFKAQDYELMSSCFKEFCIRGMLGFYSKLSNKPYVLDKSRGWAINFNFLNSFYPNPKIICMVRDLRSILASYEKLERERSLLQNSSINHSQLLNTTTIKRINNRLNSAPIGLALNRLEEIILQKIDYNILFIKYEDLCLNPGFFLKNIYDYFEIDFYKKHDLNNIKQLTLEDDSVYGFKNLHSIRNSISTSTTNYEEILGKNASSEIFTTFKWYFDYFNYSE